MAKFVLTDASVTVNGVNLSAWVQSVTVETTRDDVEVTAMGAVQKEYRGGLGDATISVTFFSDFATGGPHATLYPLSTGTTPFPVIVKPTSAATSTTNPSFWISALMFGYTPLDGSVGDASQFDVEFRNAAQVGMIVSTA
jgi:hypothetical protein